MKPLTSNPSIVVLTGGRGSRMGDATFNRPKSLLLVDGKPLIFHILEQIERTFSATEIILAVGYQANQIRAAIGDQFGSLSILYVEDSRTLETRKRTQQAIRTLKPPFIIMGSDVIYSGEQIKAVLGRYEAGMDARSMGVIAAANSHHPTYGHVVAKIVDGVVTEYRYLPAEELTGDDYRDLHLYCFDDAFRTVLNQAPEDIDLIEKVFMWAMSRGDIFLGSIYKGVWYHFAEERDLKQSIRL